MVLTASNFITAVHTIAFQITLVASRNALIVGMTCELVVGAQRPRRIGRAVSLVGTIATIVIWVASPCLQDALLIGTSEFVRFASVRIYRSSLPQNVQISKMLSTYCIDFRRSRRCSRIYHHRLDFWRCSRRSNKWLVVVRKLVDGLELVSLDTKMCTFNNSTNYIFNTCVRGTSRNLPWTQMKHW